MIISNFIKYIGGLIMLSIISVNLLQAQALPTVPSNKPQVNITATPSGTAPLQTIPAPYVQGSQLNYVRTKTGLTPIADEGTFDASSFNNVNQSTQYLDGLGRPVQTVIRQITPGSSPQDMVMPVEYDAVGREQFKYLPYVQTTGTNTSDGTFKMDPFHGQDHFYKNDYKDAGGKLMYDGEQYLYGQMNFEASPLNRVNSNFSPGNSWVGKGKGISQQYLFNTTPDDVQVWTIASDVLTMVNQTATDIPIRSTAYASGELLKNVTIDESGNAVVEYKDKEGQVLLKKVQIGAIANDFSGYTGWLCTYYIYDDLRRLRFVIPPAAVDVIKSDWSLGNHANVISELCFRYEYDSRNRMIDKKVPGSDWTEMIYDVYDRLVYTRDGNMRINHQWMVTLYDALNRQVLTGMVVQCDLTRDQLQPYVDNAVVSIVTVNGATPSPTPSAMSVTVFKAGTTIYHASESITLLPGFTSGDTAFFVAEIVPDTPTAFNRQVTATDPRPGTYIFVALTMTYYDNYTDLGGASYTQSYNAKLDYGTNAAPEALLTTNDESGVNAIGLVTGTKVRILEDPSDLSLGKWLTTTMFYDNKGRVIQTQVDNATGGTDINTIRYDFTGKIISSYLVQNNPKANSITTISTLDNYDFAGRLLNIYKTINDLGSPMLIASNTYDELGNLKSKELGQKRLEAGPIEKLDYDYNVRGWLKGINAAYSHPELLSSTTVDRWFGMELNYDYGSETSSGDKNQYNGNISSVTWRSKGDGVKRAYGYTYDKANRILSADFSERNATSTNYSDNPNVSFDVVMDTGIPGYSGYDANGNIRGMTQWGLKLNTSPAIDQLTYDYYTNSNKLSSVSEPSNTTPQNLGDFTDNHAGSNDYGYDVNGNMITDLNKRIKGTSTTTPSFDQTGGGIVYNHLNLPWQINVKKDDNSSSKGYVKYIYDAMGNKLSKTVHEEGVIEDKVTDYVGGMVYEQNILQFIAHEEGRTRITDTGGVVTQNYDYFIKDYLGNVRMVLTDETAQTAYPAATLETASLDQEKLYYNIPDAQSVRVNKNSVPGYPTDNYSNPNDFIHQLNGNGTKIGSSILLKVMAGDKVNIRASSWYKLNGANPAAKTSAASALADILTNLVAQGSGGKFTQEALNSSGLMSPLATTFINNRDATTPAGSKPDAYLNWILFDNQMKPVITSDGKNSGADPVGDDNTLKTHTITEREMSQSGYLYIYVSNESQNVNVFFDNLQVTHIKGPLLEETHYYPFGLTMQGISSKAAGSVINRNKFNGGNEFQNGEFSDGSGLELYDAANRMYDPQLGRFGQIDKLADVLFNYSPYLFGNNNPILYNDPLGLLSTPGNPEVLEEAFVTAKKKNPLNNLSYASTTAWVDKQRGNGFNDNQINTFLDRQHLNNQARDKFNDAMSQAATNIREAEAEYWKEQAEIAKLIGLSLVPVGEIGGLVGTIGGRVINVIAKSGGKVLGEAVAEGANVVYQGVDASGVVRYVGITERAPAIRFAEHASSLGTGKENLVYRVVDGATGLSRTQARVVEQKLINQFGLGKQGGQLLNKINSIAPKNWVQYGVK